MTLEELAYRVDQLERTQRERDAAGIDFTAVLASWPGAHAVDDEAELRLVARLAQSLIAASQQIKSEMRAQRPG